MDFSLNDEQKMLIETVRRFIAEECHPLEDEIEEKGFFDPAKAQALHDKARALGLYGMNMPEELGGGGLSNLDRILCEEQFGHTTDIIIRRAFGNVYEPLLHCQGEQITRWLKPAVAGERTCAIAITEPGAGSDAAGIKTRAEKTATGAIFITAVVILSIMCESMSRLRMNSSARDPMPAAPTLRFSLRPVPAAVADQQQPPHLKCPRRPSRASGCRIPA